MKTIFTLALFITAAWVGKPLQAQCIEPSQIDSAFACFAVYQPVCGCDGVTYTNYCHAEHYGGVTSYTTGVCATTVQQCCQALFDYESHTGGGGHTVTFNNQSYGCFVAQYWDFGDGTGSYGFAPSHTYSTTQFPVNGRAKVCLSVYNLPDSCYDKICGYIYFNHDPYPCVDSSLVTPNACAVPVITVCGCNGLQYTSACEAINRAGVTGWNIGTCPVNNACRASFRYETKATPIGYSVSFFNTGATNNATFAWSFGDGGTSALQNPEYLYTVPGDYTACLTITDTSTNCTSIYCRYMQVQDPICVDSSKIVSSISCPGVVDPVCGCNGITYDNDCIATAAGVKYWRRGACGTQQCYAYFNYIIDSTSGAVTFTNHSTTNTFLQWDFGNSTSNAQNPVQTFSIPGIYPVCLSITNGNCTNVYCDTVFMDFTGVAHRAAASSTKVYPNPFSSEVFIQFPTGQGPITVWVTDLSGKRIATLAENDMETQLRWDAGAQPAGYYLLHYQSQGEGGVSKLLLMK